MLNREVIERVPERFRKILLREIEPLITKNVLAVGLSGSLSRGDYWDGADIDIDIIVRGDRPYVVLLKFKEVEVDFAYFAKSQLERLPYDVVPIYDPHSIIEEILEKRDPTDLRQKMIHNSINRSKKQLGRAKAFLSNDQPYSCLSSIHQAAEGIVEALILSKGESPTTRRTISRLEKAMSKKEEGSLFEKYLSVYNITENLERVEFFYNTIKKAYNEIWDSLKENGIASITISPESTFHNFFRSRFETIYHNDKRDFIWFTFHEFQFVLQYFFKIENLDNLSDLNKLPLLWTESYRAMLETITFDMLSVYDTALHLVEELETM